MNNTRNYRLTYLYCDNYNELNHTYSKHPNDEERIILFPDF